MQNSIANIVQSHIPDHIVDSSPLFLNFIKTYYEYADKRKNAIGSIQNYHLDVDIDQTSDDYISNFYNTYGKFIPKSIALDKRNFLKLLNSIYEAKGTENALKLIFRIIFDEHIDITYPGEQSIKASDGKWVQYSFIELETIPDNFGNLPNLPNIGDVLTTDNNVNLIIENIEKIDDLITRFYFKTYNKIELIRDQIIECLNGISSYSGKILLSPNRLKIVSGGKSWQTGQLVVIKGEKKDTIARVTSIGPLGVIKTLEIIEYGYPHQNGDFSIISPYPNKPFGSIVDIFFSESNNSKTYTINISDYTEGTEESIIGTLIVGENTLSPDSYIDIGYVEQGYIIVTLPNTDNYTDSDYIESDYVAINSYIQDDYIENDYITSNYNLSLNNYFLNNYASQDYNNNAPIITIIEEVLKSDATINLNIDPSLSIDKWLSSRVILQHNFSTITKTRGRFDDNSGQPSDIANKIQDNYFYQPFSYLVESKINIDDYRQLLNITHPAGTKQFAQLYKGLSYEFSYESDTNVLINDLNFTDITNITDFIDLSSSFNRMFENSVISYDDKIIENSEYAELYFGEIYTEVSFIDNINIELNNI